MLNSPVLNVGVAENVTVEDDSDSPFTTFTAALLFPVPSFRLPDPPVLIDRLKFPVFVICDDSLAPNLMPLKEFPEPLWVRTRSDWPFVPVPT